ncbi:anoctamin-10-like [Pelodytes ibericus]
MASWTLVTCKCCQMESVQTLAVIQLRPDIKPETKQWLIHLLQKPAKHGGPHLLVHPGEDDEGHILLLSATQCLLLQATECLGFSRMDSHGSMRMFSYSHRNHFIHSDKMNLFLTLSEQQLILRQEVENMKVQEQTPIPGYPHHSLLPGQHVIHFLKKMEIIVKFYPLHDQHELESLTARWYKNFTPAPQPIDAIRAYFGEPVAVYFNFLGFFTISLSAVMLLSCFCALFQDSLDKYIYFAGFNILWSTVTMEFWKRHSSVKAFFWGTLQRKSYFNPSRAQFWGSLARSPITGKWELHYPRWKQKLRILFVTIPTVCIFLGLAVDGMVMYLYWEKRTRDQYQESGQISSAIILYLPGIIHTLFMETLNMVYKKTAATLTDWENHRLESSYESHLTIKVLVFRCFNCFGLLFYITFYLQDVQLLRKRLSSLLIVSQAINQFNEFLLPYLHKRIKLDGSLFKKRPAEGDPFIDQVMSEGDLTSYPGLFDDYMELFVQFGYISLFSCVYPFTAALLILNNITEIRTDAFKLCQVYQKPFPELTDSIGVWQGALEMIGYFSVVTNCFLICLSSEAQSLRQQYGIRDEALILYMLGAEHVLIGIKLVLAFIIPDKPAWLQKKMKQMEYNSQKALSESAWKQTL